MNDFLTKILTRRSIRSDKKSSIPNSPATEFPQGIKINPVEKFKLANNFSNLTLAQYSSRLFSILAKEKEISQGVFYVVEHQNSTPYLRYVTGFAVPQRDQVSDIVEFGEGLPGQVAESAEMINISDIPADYFMIESGLGKSAPASLLIFPVKYGNNVIAVIELSSFCRFTPDDESFFAEISLSIAEQIRKCENILN